MVVVSNCLGTLQDVDLQFVYPFHVGKMATMRQGDDSMTIGRLV